MPTKSKKQTKAKAKPKPEPQEKSSEQTLSDTMTRVRNELRDEGKSKVDIEKEASGFSGVAEAILTSSALHEGLTIKARVNKKSVSASVVNEDD